MNFLISRNQSVNEKVKEVTGLSNLDALFLSEEEIKNLFSSCMLLDSRNYNYPEDSMQVKYLTKFAEYFGEERYYFCNEYHRFLDTVEADRLLRESREKCKMTQREYADHLGIPYYRYKSYEEGRCKISREAFDLLRNKVDLKL